MVLNWAVTTPHHSRRGKHPSHKNRNQTNGEQQTTKEVLNKVSGSFQEQTLVPVIDTSYFSGLNMASILGFIESLSTLICLVPISFILADIRATLLVLSIRLLKISALSPNVFLAYLSIKFFSCEEGKL